MKLVAALKRKGVSILAVLLACGLLASGGLFPVVAASTQRSSGGVIDPSPPAPDSPLVGTCTRDGNITVTIAGVARSAIHFECGGAASITSNSGGNPIASASGINHIRFPVNPQYSGQYDYFVYWSGTSCNTSCTATEVSETSTMSPNTAYWSDQDNAYGPNGFCGQTLNYQDVMLVGTSGNSYANQWGIANINWGGFLCSSGTVTENWYNVLQGTNLNSGYNFITWFAVNSNGVPTSAGLEVSTSSSVYYYNTNNMPSHNPNILISGWEQNIVCGYNGCYTTFSGGGGSMTYYQANIADTTPQTGTYTSENSNCAYSSITIVGTGLATQTFSC